MKKGKYQEERAKKNTVLSPNKKQKPLRFLFFVYDV